MNPQDINTQPHEIPSSPITTPPSQPSVSSKSKKRGIFWLIGPALFVVAGFTLAFINQFTGLDNPIHVVLNLVSFILIGGGSLAFIPGLVYGIVLLNKK